MFRAIAPLLLLFAIFPPTASAADPLFTDYDVRDATDDSVAYPDIRLPQTDISRFTSKVVGGEVVQTVHVVGPWPENNYWVEVRNDFGFSESYTMKVERTNSSGSGPKPTDYNTSLFQTLDPGKAGKRVNFNFSREGNTMTFRWPAAEIPTGAKCLGPRITTLSRTMSNGRSTQVDDDLVVSPTACNSNGARTEGLNGTCRATTSAVVKASKLDDARADVAERENIAWRPYDNATLDILSLENSLEDGWVVQRVTLAEPSPRDQVSLTIENQYRGNGSEYERGAMLAINLFESAANGAIIGESTPGSFHVRVERLAPAGWELRWCASLIPADATCFASIARATLQNGRYQDTVGLAKDPCPAPKEGSDTGGDDDPTDATPADGAPDDEAAGEPEKGSPGIGAIALVAAVALAALAFRRRA